MSKFEDVIYKIARHDAVKSASLLQWFLSVAIGLVMFFSIVIGLCRVDISIPVKISSPTGLGVSKNYSDQIKNKTRIKLKYKNRYYEFKILKADPRFFDSIHLEVAPEIPVILRVAVPYKIRLIVDQPRMVKLILKK